MSMTILPDEDRREDEGESGGGMRRLLFGWKGWALVPLGVLIYEVTSDPTLGLMVACLKFALADWETGLYVYRVDPNRARARSVLAFALADGLIKSAVWAAVGWFVMLPLFFVAFMLGVNGIALARQFFALLWFLAAVAWPIAVLCVAAIAVGLIGRVPIWIGPEVRRGAKRRAWPPFLMPEPRPGRPARRPQNEAAMAIATLPLVLMLAPLLLIPEAIPAFNRLTATPAHIRVPSALGALALIMGGMWAMGQVVQRTVAHSPEIGWPEMIFVEPDPNEIEFEEDEPDDEE